MKNIFLIAAILFAGTLAAQELDEAALDPMVYPSCSEARVEIPSTVLGKDSLYIEVENIREFRLSFLGPTGYPLYSYQEELSRMNREEGKAWKETLAIPLDKLKEAASVQANYYMYTSRAICFDKQELRKTGGILWLPDAEEAPAREQSEN